jgi:transposase
LVTAGYEVFAINPKSSAHYRELHSSSGAKSDPGDAHVLAEIVRLDRAHHRPVAADPVHGESVKLVARAHQSMVWDRTRHVLRLRSTLREFLPAALAAYGDLDEPDTLQLLAIAPDPDLAARLSTAKISAVLAHAHRRNLAARAQQIQHVLRTPALRQPGPVQAAFAAIAASEVRMIAALNTELAALGAGRLTWTKR